MPAQPPQSQKVDNEIGSSTYETRGGGKGEIYGYTRADSDLADGKENKLFFVCLK